MLPPEALISHGANGIEVRYVSTADGIGITGVSEYTLRSTLVGKKLEAIDRQYTVLAAPATVKDVRVLQDSSIDTDAIYPEQVELLIGFDGQSPELFFPPPVEISMRDSTILLLRVHVI